MSAKTTLLAAITIVSAPHLLLRAEKPESRSHRVTDTVFVRQEIDYDELARRVAVRLEQEKSTVPTIIDGDLIIKGRLGVGGAPETGTDYGITVRAPVSSGIRFVSNESLKDPQRVANQHRHVGGISLSQDGGLRLDVNSTCYADSRGCVTEDKARRRAYTGYDSMGDYAWYLSNVDSLTGQTDAPRAQSLVFRLIGDDGHIHLTAFRAGQKIFLNGSTATNAADLQWEVPLAPITPPPQQ